MNRVIRIAALMASLVAGLTAAQAQVANPNEMNKGDGKGASDVGKSKLGGTMPNEQVPAMTPGAPQSSSAGTTMGPDGKLTPNSGTSTDTMSNTPSKSGTMPKQ